MLKNNKGGQPVNTTEELPLKGTITEMVPLCLLDPEIMSKHLFTVDWNQQQFQKCKRNLQCNEVLMILEIALTYLYTYQDEAQHAH